MEDKLVQDFVALYAPKEDQQTPLLEPTIEELAEIEDDLGEVLSALNLVELDDQAHLDLRGKRVADMADLMGSAADGLRGAKSIQEVIKTDPRLFEQVAAQDLALGGLTQSFQVIYQAADAGLLRNLAEAEEILDGIDEKLALLLKDDKTEKPQLLANHHAPLLEKRRSLEERFRGEAASDAGEEVRLKEAEESDRDADLLRALVRYARSTSRGRVSTP